MSRTQQEWDNTGQNSNRNANESIDMGQESSVVSTQSQMLGEILENLKVDTYSHKVNSVPPYVLDRLAQIPEKDRKELLSSGNETQTTDEKENRTQSPSYKKGDDGQYRNFGNDLFIRSMDNNWSALLETFRQKNAYTPGAERFNEDFNEKNYDSPWGGGERLRNALDGTGLEEQKESRKDEWSPIASFFSLGKKKNKGRSLRDEPYRNRSQRSHYMLNERKTHIVPAVNRVLLVNPLFPLFLRILMLIFSIIALALASSIFVLSNRTYEGRHVDQQASTIMAIVVQCFAITYLVYIAYDEYSGRPLGLRDPLGKMKLIMLDLLFIIFSSANLALAFNTLDDDRWVCLVSGSSSMYTSFEVGSICRRQRGLVSFLLVATFLWVTAFTISIVRVVERVTTAGGPGVNV